MILMNVTGHINFPLLDLDLDLGISIFMNVTGHINFPLLESPALPEIVNPLLPLDFPASTS